MIFVCLLQLFEISYVHIGGDEVLTACWKEANDIHEWVDEQQISYRALFASFELRVMEIIYQYNKVPLAWQGVVDEGQLPPENPSMNPEDQLVVQPWKCWSQLAVNAATKSIAGGWHFHKPQTS